MISQFTIFVVILSGISVSNGYRFLAIFPFPGRSHFHVLAPVAKSLAQKGHRIDVISHFKLEEPFPNYNELDFSEDFSHARVEFNLTSSPVIEREWQKEMTTRICNLLGHATVKELLKNPPTNPPYDAVIVHIAFATQCLTAIGDELNVPVIAVATTMAYAIFQQFIGNPLSLAIASGHTYYYKQNLTFLERVRNVIYTHNQLRKFKFDQDIQDEFIKKYLGKKIPDYSEVQKNIALMLSNSHYSFYGIKPMTPALVEIGGIHIKNDTSKLSSGLKKILDKSIHGFIYFSFGTLTVLESLPADFSNIIFNTFCKMSPIRVIMRVPNPDFMPKDICDNIFGYKWLPQQKLLEHKNIKAFVTHGGGLSSQETIHYAVPVICIPMFADQNVNCDIFALKNMGVKINIETAQQRDYENAFQEVLSNPKYKDTMKMFSQLYWDRPLSPQEATTYWVEYVVRHGRNVLRSPAIDLEWWQFDLIDVYYFLFTCFILAFILSFITVKYTVQLIIRLSSPVNILKSDKKCN